MVALRNHIPCLLCVLKVVRSVVRDFIYHVSMRTTVHFNEAQSDINEVSKNADHIAQQQQQQQHSPCLQERRNITELQVPWPNTGKDCYPPSILAIEVSASSSIEDGFLPQSLESTWLESWHVQRQTPSHFAFHRSRKTTFQCSSNNETCRIALVQLCSVIWKRCNRAMKLKLSRIWKCYQNFLKMLANQRNVQWADISQYCRAVILNKPGSCLSVTKSV